MTVQQNLYNEYDENLERAILKKFNLANHYTNIIAFRTMLEDGINSFESLKEHIQFIKLFPIYLFNTSCLQSVLDDPLTYWKSSYEYDLCIPLHRKNFYKIGEYLYYVDY